MLCKRVVVLLTLSHGRLVRTKRFRIDRWYSLEAFSFRGADEICVIDVTPGGADRVATATTVERVVSEAFVPVTLGGGLRTLEDARWAFGCGADKLLSSSIEFCEAVADDYGEQAVVWGATFAPDFPPDHPRLCGEVLLQSVVRDGSLMGYDPFMPDPVNRPLVVGSGCGSWRHMLDAFEAGADACATSNVLHFSETALASCKKYLGDHGIKVRP